MEGEANLRRLVAFVVVIAAATAFAAYAYNAQCVPWNDPGLILFQTQLLLNFAGRPFLPLPQGRWFSLLRQATHAVLVGCCVAIFSGRSGAAAALLAPYAAWLTFHLGGTLQRPAMPESRPLTPK